MLFFSTGACRLLALNFEEVHSCVDRFVGGESRWVHILVAVSTSSFRVFNFRGV